MAVVIKVDKIEQSNLAYVVVTDPYYNYCVDLLKSNLEQIKNPVNLILLYFGFEDYNFNNGYKTIKICIQYEHTLVKVGGRDTNNSEIGGIKNNGKENYLVRIDRYDYLKNLDFIIEYSKPNIHNISTIKKYDEYLKKNIYIAPIIEINFNNFNKKDTITLFGSNKSDRRNNFYNKINKYGINCINKFGFTTENELKKLYSSTKILVNIHQTDHHHTFEELRVLPALCQGTIIISENVPLKEKIPYSEYIIWCDYDEITNKILEIQNNYEFFYNKIFNKNLLNQLNELNLNNKLNLKMINKI